MTTPAAGTPTPPPSPERWQAIEETLDRALALPPGDRASFLDLACAGDPALRREVESLIASEPESGFLERPVLPELRAANDGAHGTSGAYHLPSDDALQLEANAQDPFGGLPRGAHPIARSGNGASVAARLASALADRYELEHELGHGGMAMVFLARDVRHRRRVAIKVLYPELSAVLGPDRFLKEIELTASLQHPHILPLYDSGSADGLLYYVMPFVEGETLRARLERERHLPVADALRIAGEVAGALTYAHARGIVHRDIKPENILLQGEHAVVADFGIALAVQHAGGERMTRTGLSLGTPQYMAPEQAMGDRVVDARADVYALGAVTFEMLAGEAPFSGPTAQAVVARVLTESPPSLSSRRPHVPAHADAAIRMAMEKIPADRFASAAAFAAALQDVPGSIPPAPPPRPPRVAPSDATRASSFSRRTVGMLAGWAMGLVAVAALAGWFRGRASAEREVVTPVVPVVRVALDADSSVRGFGAPAIAPDGSSVVYVGRSDRGPQLLLRRVGELAPRALAGTEDAESPFFSPDGATIAYAADGILWRLSLENGTPQRLAALPDDATFAGGSWGRNDEILYSVEEGGLFRVAATGGDPVAIAAQAPAGRLLQPHHLPDARAALVTVARGDDAGRVGVIDLSTGRVREFEPGAGARFAAGQVIFTRRGGELFRQRFDLATLQPTGEVARVEQGLDGSATTPLQLSGLFDVSTAGVIALRTVEGGADAESVRLVVTDRQGRVQRTIPTRVPWSPRFSPDGARIAYGAFPAGRGPSELWVTDLVSGSTVQLTDDGRDNNDPRWSPDGEWLAYSAITSSGKDLFVRPLSGGVARQLTAEEGSEWPTGWSSDGKQVVFTQWSNGDQGDIWLAAADGSNARRLVGSPAHETGASLSPDGQSIVYQSDEGGQADIYVATMPSASAPVRISKGGGVNPMWGSNGREVLYWQDDRLLSVPIKAGTRGESPWPGPPELLFRATYTANELPMYDVSRDGSRFVLVSRGVRTEHLTLAVGLVPQAPR